MPSRAPLGGIYKRWTIAREASPVILMMSQRDRRGQQKARGGRGEEARRRGGLIARGEGGPQDSAFSFFLLFFRKEGARNFFFFLEGDLEGDPSGLTGPLVTDSVLSFGPSGVSALVFSWLIPLLRCSSTVCSSSFPLTSTASGSALSAAAASAGPWLLPGFFPPWKERERSAECLSRRAEHREPGPVSPKG